MSEAIRLPSIGGWPPVTRHYQVPGGYLAVVKLRLIGATGTQVFLVNEEGIEVTGRMEPIKRYPPGVSHEEALQQLGYQVTDDIGPEPEPEPPADPPPPPAQQVLDMLPPEMAAVIGDHLETQGSN